MQFLTGFINRTPWALPCLLWLAAILLAGCLGLGAVVSIQAARLDAADARETALADKLAAQNRAVETWKAAADAQTSKVAAAGKKAAQVRTVTIERVRTITAAAIPPACPDAIKWAAEQGPAISLRWEGNGQ